MARLNRKYTIIFTSFPIFFHNIDIQALKICNDNLIKICANENMHVQFLPEIFLLEKNVKESVGIDPSPPT